MSSSTASPHASRNTQKPHADPLKATFNQVRGGLVTVAGFSLFINLLMLVAPLYMLQVYDRVLTSGQIETLLFLTLMAGVAIMIMAILEHMRSTLTVRIGGWLSKALGPVLLANGLRARLAGSRNGAQALRDLNQVQNFIVTQGMVAFFDAPWVPIFICIIYLLHPMLGLVAIVTAVILLILSIINDKISRQPNKEATAATFEAIQIAETTIRRGEEVQAMGFLPNLLRRWSEFNNAAITANNQAGEANGMIVALTKFVRFFAQIAILGVGAALVLQQQASPGTMIAASIMLGRALAPVEMAIGSWKNFILTRQAYERLRQQLDAFPIPPRRLSQPVPTGKVVVNNLTVSAPGNETPILNKLSFELNPKEAVAIIGPSGAGKSTLCRALMGISPQVSGDIRLDGTDISHWDKQQLGHHIGYLPQDVELFPGTVGENIARMDHLNDEKVLEAAKISQAHEVIQYLPDGYDTLVGDGGLRLSGGQRQRIGLARAVYDSPKLIVLDEPNANLDQIGEQALAEAIEELKRRGCALVIVGHRPSTVAQADRIMLVQNGEISLFGPRDEVLLALSQPSQENAPPSPQQQVEQTRSPASVNHPPARVRRKSGWMSLRPLAPRLKYQQQIRAGI